MTDQEFRAWVTQEITKINARQDAEAWKLSELKASYESNHDAVRKSMESLLHKLRLHEKERSA